ncbi:MAG TPA: tetratricopeptide repeat protein [Streptosporangiaceae bacterium]|nr:tetratricopeptide repeat protein [Streptosporangiaceae bacterium]
MRLVVTGESGGQFGECFGQRAGRLGQAIPLYEHTLADRERVLGSDHPQTLTSRNNLAYAYKAAAGLAVNVNVNEME